MVSEVSSVYNTLHDRPFPKKDIPNEMLENIKNIKVIIKDFRRGIIVKNRFETYKDYFDAENLLKKLWYGEESQYSLEHFVERV